MRVLLTGGGTGGHVYPALAIAELIQRNYPSATVAFVGTERGIEYRLTTSAGYDFYPINIQGIQRSLSPKNFKTAYLILTSPSKAKKILREFRPDLVIGTGGYVCWPLLRAASSMGIPTMVHESNAKAGLAVRQLQRRVDVILANFSESEKTLSKQGKKKLVRVGNPLRTTLGTLTREEARAKLGIAENEFFLLSFGGSLGAPMINRVAATLGVSFVPKHANVRHIHVGGTRNFADAKKIFSDYGVPAEGSTELREYLYDMPTYLTAADLVISRAGAMTLTELACAKKPAILIPYPDATDNHQYENAKVLSDAGAAALFEETDKTESLVLETVERLYLCPQECAAMSQAMARCYESEAEARIHEEIVRLLTAYGKTKK